MTLMKDARILCTWEYLSQTLTKCLAKSMLKYQLARDVWAVYWGCLLYTSGLFRPAPVEARMREAPKKKLLLLL